MTERHAADGDEPLVRNRMDTTGPGIGIQAGRVRGNVDASTTNVNSRSTTISLPAYGVVLGMVLAFVAILVAWKLVAESDSSGTTPPKPSSLPTALALDVRLTNETGADVDGNESKINATPARSATGRIDLHRNLVGIMSANGSGFHDDEGPEQEAESRCRTVIAAGTYAVSSIFPDKTGKQYCFTTSEGRIAWLRVKLASSGSREVALSVRTWQP